MRPKFKEHPQEDCTNCTKDVTHWCVCAKCRKNARIIKKLQELDFNTIFEALTCLCDSGYKLTKKEKSVIGRLTTIGKMLE